MAISLDVTIKGADLLRRPERVEVTLRKGDEPRVFDADTHEELTARVHALLLMPHGQGRIRAALFTHREHVPILGEEVEVCDRDFIADLVYLRGDWEAQ
jgi:hypothetical protein